VKRPLLVAVLLSGACYGSQMSSCETGSGPSPTPTPTPIVVASATPTPSPSPTTDPCSYPVTGLRLSGPVSPLVNEVFKIDVTPVSAAGLLEGELDRCNKGRTPRVEFVSLGLRCVGQCSGYGPQFIASTTGAFTIRIRLEGVTEDFVGTAVRPSLLPPCKKFFCPDPGGTPTPTPRPEPTPDGMGEDPIPPPPPLPLPTLYLNHR